MIKDRAETNRMISRALGHYEIIQRLAVGGMAEIFLARSTAIKGFEKYVVLKRILPQFAENPRFVSMFLDEARLAARLSHQNIAQVYDFGDEDGSYYLVMEYLHGENLLTLLKRAVKQDKPIPLKHVLAIVNAVAAGLEYAHNAQDDDGAPLNIVHRDVAPSNIIVTYDGGVKLVDFGISRARSHRNETESGIIKGKISYMSPEQIRSKDLDGRSDIFALGIVLYELTTMSRLFPVGSTDKLSVMKRIVQGKIPRPSRRVYHYPPRLEKIVMRALSVEPVYRYQTIGEMLHDLERFAARKRLNLSPSELGRYIRRLAGYRPEPWRRTDRKHDDKTSSSSASDDASRADDWHNVPQPLMEAPLQSNGSTGRLPTLLPLPAHVPGDPTGESRAAPERSQPASKPRLRLVESKEDELDASELDESPHSQTMRLIELGRRSRTRLAVGLLLALLGVMGVLTLLFLRGYIELPGLQPAASSTPIVQEDTGALTPVDSELSESASVSASASESVSEPAAASESVSEPASASESEPAAASESESESESELAAALASESGPAVGSTDETVEPTADESSETANGTEAPSEASEERAQKRRSRAARRKARRANRKRAPRGDKSQSSNREWTTDDLFPPSASQ